MNYGFVINNETCIGCHACSTACKSENEVPLGVNRTWVKSVEVGAYPDVRRHFQVTRCNHCANPPCVRICPVTAMYQREDGIVEFDADVCIGCKACLQACPYDAIYIDPESGTAAKCHYCAHRVEVGLEPACVVVCPEHAIIAGDMDDPSAEISRVLAKQQVTVRKPEQGTAPNLFYINGNDTALHPTATDRTPVTFAWADVLPLQEGGDGHEAATPPLLEPAMVKQQAGSGAMLRPSQPQGVPEAGPIHIGDGRMAEQMVQVVYNAQHKIPWHWPVPAYLVTKAIAAGVFMLLGLGFGLDLFRHHTDTFVAGGLVSLLMLGVTTGLLVFDLERPERFLRILTRPQWKSWLVRGAYLLVGFSAVVGVWWLLEASASLNWLDRGLMATLRMPLLALGLPLALGTAVYTAFLFGQAEGRDLWQSTLLPIHMLLQSLMAGAGTLLILDLLMAMPTDIAAFARTCFAATLVLNLLVTLLGEFGMPHASDTAAQAAHLIHHGPYKHYFWLWSFMLGQLIPLGLLFAGEPITAALAGFFSLVGLYCYEYAFVLAPQEIANS